MYYRRVNRGLSFTKPGVYAFGLVLSIGMVAVSTGINGLYVFLSAGLGGFIISGLLSEKAMKSCSIVQVAAARADAGQPFTLAFTVSNSSSWFSVFALQNLFLTSHPRFRLISGDRPSFAAVKLTRVPPASALTYEATCGSLQRGAYTKVLAMQLTTFPFGILEKFKLSEVPASLLVAPGIERAFLEELRFVLRAKLAQAALDHEFYSHRAYVAGDAARAIDWRKSAGRAPGEWVVKQYRSPRQEDRLRLEAPWSIAVAAADEAAYEAYLSRIRTALKVFDESGRDVLTDFGSGSTVAGVEAAVEALARAPAFADRARGPGVGRHSDERGEGATAATLALTATAFEWRG